MIGYVILALTLSVFAVAFGFIIYEKLTTTFPKGRRLTLKSGSRAQHTIIAPNSNLQGISHIALHNQCVWAMDCLRSAAAVIPRPIFVTLPKGSSLKNLETYIVYIIPQSEMISGAAAYTTQYDGIPSAVISDQYVHEIMSIGQPVIHEACHAFLNDYIGDINDHANPFIWKNKDSLIREAEKLCVER